MSGTAKHAHTHNYHTRSHSRSHTLTRSHTHTGEAAAITMYDFGDAMTERGEDDFDWPQPDSDGSESYDTYDFQRQTGQWLTHLAAAAVAAAAVIALN